MHQQHSTTLRKQRGQEPPIVAELRAIFDTLPDDDLLAMLQRRGRGRRGYQPQILWRCYVAYYVLGIESVSTLIRLLRNNPYVAAACGIESPEQMPSQPTFSRFGTRLAKPRLQLAVRNIQRALTRRFYDRYPDFGKMVAIDSTHMRAWSNGAKRGKRHSVVTRQRPRVGKVSDTDAGWVVKTNTEGNKQFTWGYKAHIICDAQYEIPIAVEVTKGNAHDVTKATALLQQIRYSFHVNPRYFLADAAYSSDHVRQVLARQYSAIPIIDPNPSHKRAVGRTERTPEWRAIYKKRTAVERVNSRLKAFYKLDSVRVRTRPKVRLHTFLSVIALQARGLAFPQKLRHCTLTSASHQPPVNLGHVLLPKA